VSGRNASDFRGGTIAILIKTVVSKNRKRGEAKAYGSHLTLEENTPATFMPVTSMKGWSRRDLLKSSALVAPTSGIDASPKQPDGEAQVTAPLSGGSNDTPFRERLLLDFGWRFHFGHANDAAKDFGFGRSGEMTAFQKTGNFLSPSRLT
jgi:hypothetical protein